MSLTKKVSLPLYVALRVVLLGAVVTLVALAIRSASASLEPAQGSVALVPMTQPPGDGQQFRVNNGLMQLTTESSQVPMEELLDRVASDCPEATIERNGSNATVSCPSFGGGTVPTLSLVEGNGTGSKLMELAPHEAIDLRQLLPREGDAPGFDIPQVPRLPKTERLMSFEDPSGQYRSVFYGGGDSSVERSLQWYRTNLVKAGWTMLALETPNEPRIFANRQGLLVMLQVTRGCQGTCTAVLATPM
ncbi:MAG: hypothetical protein GY811_05285 [Myxococcales bacterium]|nr:hypothetical protein [Myxococcales bacterium]